MNELKEKVKKAKKYERAVTIIFLVVAILGVLALVGIRYVDKNDIQMTSTFWVVFGAWFVVSIVLMIIETCLFRKSNIANDKCNEHVIGDIKYLITSIVHSEDFVIIDAEGLNYKVAFHNVQVDYDYVQEMVNARVAVLNSIAKSNIKIELL